jgi:hypothetical protein
LTLSWIDADNLAGQVGIALVSPLAKFRNPFEDRPAQYHPIVQPNNTPWLESTPSRVLTVFASVLLLCPVTSRFYNQQLRSSRNITPIALSSESSRVNRLQSNKTLILRTISQMD